MARGAQAGAAAKVLIRARGSQRHGARLSLPADDDDQSAAKFCETQWMARTDDEKWLVVDVPRWRRTDLALPADARDDSGRQDLGW